MPKKYQIVAIFLSLTQCVSATVGNGVFAKYMNKYFIETGSLHGDGIQKALDAGFEEVYSIELSQPLYNNCKNRFVNDKNVHLLNGDSTQMLPLILQEIDEPATFWLDGHYSGPGTEKGEALTPILKELDAIRQHSIKTHTILIDDVRLFGTYQFDYINIGKIMGLLKEINSNYVFVFEDGHVENDILVAFIKE